MVVVGGASISALWLSSCRDEVRWRVNVIEDEGEVARKCSSKTPPPIPFPVTGRFHVNKKGKTEVAC